MGKNREIAAALNELAQLERLDDHLDVARQLYAQVLDLARALDDRASIAVALLNLSMVAVLDGIDTDVREMLIEVHAIAGEIDSRPTAQTLLDVCAALATKREDWWNAARFFGAAEHLTEHIGLQRHPADEAFLQSFIGRAKTARGSEWSIAEREGRAVAYQEMMTVAQAWLQRSPTVSLSSSGFTSR